MTKFNHITNEIFLREVFQEDYPKALVTSFPEDPGAIPTGQSARCWHVQPFNPVGFPPGNQYYCTSTFHGILRRKAEFECMHLIVVDDIDEKIPEFMMSQLPEPSFKLKTSAHSEQWGYFIKRPWFMDYSALQNSNLIDGFIAKLTHDGKDPGMAGVTRLVRLPKGLNSKKSRLIDGWCPFECELIAWDPENRYSLETLADCLDIDINAPRNEGEGGNAGYEGGDNPVFLLMEELGMIKHAGNNPGAYEVHCPYEHEHSQGGTGTQVQFYADGGANLDCKHRCSQRPQSDFLAWQRAQVNHKKFQENWNFKQSSDAFAAAGCGTFVEGKASQGNGNGSTVVSVMPTEIEADIFHKLKSFFNGDTEAASEAFFRKPLRDAWPQVFYNGNKAKAFLFNGNGALIQGSDQKIRGYLEKIHGPFLDLAAIGAQATVAGLSAVEVSKFTNGLFRVFMQQVEIDHQRDSIEFAVDMFADHPHMQVHKAGVNVTYSYVPLVSQNPLALMGQIDVGTMDEVVADYVQHFPDFHNFLDLLKSARFANVAREGSLWMQAASDWGKTFLMNGVLGDDLKIVTEVSMTEIEKVFEGTPIGKTAQDFIYSWLLFIDEAKVIKSEGKLIDSHISGSPKHQLSFKTKVYAKVYCSATDIPSLGGETGVENQFANRLGYINPGSGKLDQRVMFKDLGGLKYRGALSTYVAQELNAFVEKMRAMGFNQATKYCEDKLKSVHAEWCITKTQGDLNESLEEIAKDMKVDLIAIADGSYSKQIHNPAQRDMAAMWNTENIIVGYHQKYGRVIQVLNATKMIETWVPVKFSKSEVGKIMVMKSALLDLLHEGGNSRRDRIRLIKDDGKHTRKAGPIVFAVGNPV